MIKKYYADQIQGQTHYRRSGSGRPMVLLHASPMSSELMVPLIEVLAKRADVIAPDTPGYGQSNQLPKYLLDSTDDLMPYVEWLRNFLDALGLDKIGLYGTATGAQIGIEFARTYPEKLDFLILDNAAHFSDEERQEITSEYFPSLQPKSDGSHLTDAWNMAQGVFTWFPWYRQDDEHRISKTSPPTQAVHATAMAYLTAGVDYAQAYKRAFFNEDANRVIDITVPVRVIRWDASVVKKYADLFDNFEWPDNVQMRACSGDMAERYATILATVNEF